MRHLMWTAMAFALVAGCEDPAENVTPAVVGEAEGAAPGAQADEAEDEAADERAALPFDTARSSVGFTGAKITASHDGTFTRWSGTLRHDPESFENSAIEITIQMASVQIEPARLQNHLRSPDLFDVDRFPTAIFESTRIEATPAGTEGATHQVTGRLTLHGQTRSITFPTRVEVTAEEVHATAEFRIDRQEFGITYPGMPDDLIRDQVVIRFDVRAPRT